MPVRAAAIRSGMSLLVVAVFGAEGIELQSPGPDRKTETRELRCLCFPDDSNLEAVLVNERPHVLVTFGEANQYQRLMRAPFEVRKRWLHYARGTDLNEVGRGVYHCLLHNALEPRESPPLVSVFTPAYRTGERIQRPLKSLLQQDYANWEWVIIDDSDDDGLTYGELSRLAATEHRIALYRGHRHSGRIGDVKQMACRLSRGQILVELDHDDELTAGAISAVVVVLKNRKREVFTTAFGAAEFFNELA